MKQTIDIITEIADKAYQMFEAGETKESLLNKLKKVGIDTENENIMTALNTAWNAYSVARRAVTNETYFERKKKGNKFYYRIKNMTRWRTELNMDLYLCNFGFYDFQEIIYEDGNPVGIWKQSGTGHWILKIET